MLAIGSAAQQGFGVVATAEHSAEAASGGLRPLTLSIIKDFVELGQEAASGNFSRIPGTLLSLAVGMEGLGPGAALGVAGAAALVAGLIYLANESAESSEAVNQLALSASFNGIDLPPTKLQALTESIAAAGNISRSSAMIIVGAMENVKGATADSLDATSRVVQNYADLTGQTTKEASESLSKMFSDPLVHVQEFVGSLGNVTTAQVLAADDAAHSGNAYRALAVMVDAITAAEDRNKQALIDKRSAVTASTSNLISYLGAIDLSATATESDTTATQNAKSVTEAHTDIVKGNTQAWDANASAIQHATATLQNYESLPPPQQIALGIIAGEAADPLGQRLQADQTRIVQITTAMGLLAAESASLQDQQTGDAASGTAKLVALGHQLTEAEQQEQQTSEQIALDDPALKLTEARERAQSAASKAGSQQRIADAQNEVAQIAAALKKQNLDPQQSPDYWAAVEKLNQAKQAAAEQGARGVAAADKIGAEDAIQAARNASEEILSNDRLNATERAELASGVWNLLSNGDKQSADQRAAAAKELADKIADEEHLTADQRAALEKQISALLVTSGQWTAQQRAQAARDEGNAESDVRKKAAKDAEQADKDTLAAKIESIKAESEITIAGLQEQAAYGEITATQEMALSQAVSEQEIRTHLDIVTARRNAENQGSAAWLTYDKQVTQLSSQLGIKVAQDAATTAKAIKDEWTGILSPIESGFSGMVSSMIQGNQSFAQTTRQMLVSLVSDFINARIKIEFDWLAGVAAREFGDQDWAKKSVLQAIFSSDTIDDTQQASLDKFLADEGAKTAAELEGQTVRTSAAVTGAATSNAAEATANSTSIINSAYTAGASAFKWVMQEVPFPLNVVLAPVAAAAAFAGVAAFDVIKSAEGGDPMVSAGVYQLHEREMVIPQGIADPMREFFAGAVGPSCARNFDGSLAGGAAASQHTETLRHIMESFSRDSETETTALRQISDTISRKSSQQSISSSDSSSETSVPRHVSETLLRESAAPGTLDGSLEGGAAATTAHAPAVPGATAASTIAHLALGQQSPVAIQSAAQIVAASIAGLSTRPLNLSGGLGGGAQANLLCRITMPQTQEQVETALLSASAKTGGSVAGAGPSRSGDTYNINAVDAASFKQFLARADTRRVLKQSAQSAVRGGVSGNLA